uniref:Uncharacterized protein n=1 Tax=Candidatus Kentrum sp. MB TaxID=2138164 RepID=A0A450X8Q0_9GAMM|nr:MAG: hypothetical protein BECKMB1821G_GA0114241_101532 [Candidatus Kentron sp. MB]VFK29679.1 MAG: hypothetical protein BECKMB1821I_GA0114274_101131 [Candidatus Kentron sp. MB]VFK74868.1 MAG: hypothetical protein BECKMB1821H_GA0114242_101131 [Candidatus Kentron sp. MB]
MNSLLLFGSCYLLVLFLGLQNLNVNGGHRLLAMLTSFGIGAANLTVLKIMPGPTNLVDIMAYLLGGPLGIWTSMAIHPWMARRFGKQQSPEPCGLDEFL